MHLTLPSASLANTIAAVKHIVPTRPLNPIEGQVRLLVDGTSLVADVTDGRLQLRHISNSVKEGEGFDVFPAHRLDDFLEFMPPKAALSIEIDEKRVARLAAEDVEFTTPLLTQEHANQFPAFPEDDGEWEPRGTYVASALLNALDRVQYAVGGEGVRDDLRMVQILDGAVRAYSGFRLQEVKLGEFEGEVLLVDYAVQPLARFLRSLPKGAEVLIVAHPEKLKYNFIFGTPTSGMLLAVPMPAIPFVDLGGVYRAAEKQLETANRLRLDRDQLMEAVTAARLQSPPDALSVNLTLGDHVVVSAAVDDANRFQRVLSADSYEGDEDGRTVSASIDDLLGLLGGAVDEKVTLFVSDASYTRGTTMPMIQTRDDDTQSVGIISQA